MIEELGALLNVNAGAGEKTDSETGASFATGGFIDG
jgi:hypothetical protein